MRTSTARPRADERTLTLYWRASIWVELTTWIPAASTNAGASAFDVPGKVNGRRAPTSAANPSAARHLLMRPRPSETDIPVPIFDGGLPCSCTWTAGGCVLREDVFGGEAGPRQRCEHR